MKNLYRNLLVVTASVCIFSCSKKLTTFNFGKPYYDQQASQVKEQVQPEESEEIITTSVSEVPVILNEKQEIAKKIKPASSAAATVKLPDTEKPGFKEKIAAKLIKKKIQKLEKNQAVSNNMRLGIIIAAISLVVLIVVAAGLLGGLSGLFWLLGGLGLLTGLVIILLAALDVI